LNKERATSKSVRFIPYVLVPGMDVNSRLFHKAQATIAKQAHVAASSASTVSAERKAHVDRLFNLQQGTLRFLLSL
jgi:hypothetical protein